MRIKVFNSYNCTREWEKKQRIDTVQYIFACVIWFLTNYIFTFKIFMKKCKHVNVCDIVDMRFGMMVLDIS